MNGIHPMLTRTNIKMDNFPTISSSVSDGFVLTLGHKSMVKIMDEELNIDVREERKAAIRTAIINPRAPDKKWQLSLIKITGNFVTCYLEALIQEQV